MYDVILRRINLQHSDEIFQTCNPMICVCRKPYWLLLMSNLSMGACAVPKSQSRCILTTTSSFTQCIINEIVYSSFHLASLSPASAFIKCLQPNPLLSLRRWDISIHPNFNSSALSQVSSETPVKSRLLLICFCSASSRSFDDGHLSMQSVSRIFGLGTCCSLVHCNSSTWSCLVRA